MYPVCSPGNAKEKSRRFCGRCRRDCISRKILEVIEPLQLDPCLCVGFSFDGISIKSGNKQEVHVLLKRTFPPRAVYVHRLNLVLGAGTTVCSLVSTFFDALNSFHTSRFHIPGSRKYRNYLIRVASVWSPSDPLTLDGARNQRL